MWVSGFTLQLDEHQLKNILVDVRMNHHAETMEPPTTDRDDLINYNQFAWLINGALAQPSLTSAAAAAQKAS